MTFSHDDHIHKGKDFPVKDSRAQRGYRRFIKPGSTATVDFDRIEDKGILTGNHAMDDYLHGMIATGLQLTLNNAKANGRTSAAQKAQRQINLSNEGRLGIRSSWCQGCLNYLHNCVCPATAAARGAAAASVSFIDRIQADIADDLAGERQQLKDYRKQQRILARQQRKAQQRQQKGATS